MHVIEVSKIWILINHSDSLIFLYLDSTTEPINALTRLAVKMINKSERIATELFQIILDKAKIISSDELVKSNVRYLFGKFLVSLGKYNVASDVLKEALSELEENYVSKNSF